MARYRFDHRLGKVVEVKQSRAPAPSIGPVVRSDTPGYRSPVTGDWIEGAAARRDDLKRHGAIDAREKYPDGRLPWVAERRRREREERGRP